MADQSKTIQELTIKNDALMARIQELESVETDSKGAVEALRESESKYRILVESSQDAIFSVDRKGYYHFVNTAFASTLGHTREYFDGKSLWDIYPKDLADMRYDAILNVFDTGQPSEVEVAVPLPDRTLYYLAKTNPIIDTQGNISQVFVTATDITARKKLEEALIKSEVRYRTLFEGATDGKALADAETGVLLECNQSLCQMVERDRAELVGQVQTILHPPSDSINGVSKTFHQHRHTGHKIAIEDQLLSKSGKLIQVEILASHVKIQDRNFVMGIFRDITERKRTEDALREIKERFVLAMEASRDGVWDWDIVTNGVYYSPSYVTMLGYAPGEVSADADFWASRIHPEDREAALRANQDCIEGRSDQFEVEFRMQCKNAEWRWILGRGKAATRDESGRAARIVGTHTDITERKTAEKVLRESEEKYRVLIESTSEPIFSVNPDGVYRFVNNAYGKLLNLNPSDIIGKNIKDVFPPDQAETRLENLRHVFESGKKECRDFTFVYGDGKERLAQVTMEPFYDEQGKPLWAIGIYSDITERKRAEEALLEKEAHYRSIFENSLFAIAVTAGQAMKFTEVNPTFCRMLEYSKEELIGKLGVGDVTHPDDEAESKGLIGQLLRRERNHFIAEKRYVTKSGRILDALVFVQTILDERGEYAASAASIMDITERKRVELEKQKFFLIAESSSEFIGMCDLDMQPLYVNPAGQRMVGLPDLAAACRVKVQDYFFQEDQKFIAEEFFPRVLKEGHGNVEIRLRHFQTGEAIWFFYYLFHVRDAGGNLVGWATVSRDITERKRAEAEREKLQAQLAQAQKMESVGRLAGGVAHDFNNMLGVILGHTEMALEQVDPAQSLFADLQEVRTAAQRSADLTRQLLAFARKQIVNPKVVDLNDTVAGMLKMLQRLIGEDIHLVWQPDSSLWPVKIDPSQLDQVLANLCINARDAIAGVGKLTIETGNISFDEDYYANHAGFVPGEYVLLAVSDDGCGMDKVTIDKIFEPFFTTKDVGYGTGLGLATVYGIVKQNGGFINVYSEPGQGTTFKIYLPRHIGKGGQARTEAALAPLQRGQESILLVEDELPLLELGKRMLETQGYRVLSASTPGEAIRLAGEYAGEVHLLMTDVVMPEMNGRNLADKILALNPNLKCLFTSGYTSNVIAHHGVLDENVHFIQKPFSRRDLAAKVRAVLDGK